LSRTRSRVLLSDRQRRHHLDPRRIRVFVLRVAADLWEEPVEVSLTLLGSRAMASANREFRGCQGVTDQISFTMPKDSKDLPYARGRRLVGDLLVCPAVVAAQCGTPPPGGRPATGTPDLELALVLAHGLLHLAGHTHNGGADAEAMIAEEIRLHGRHAVLLRGAFRPGG